MSVAPALTPLVPLNDEDADEIINECKSGLHNVLSIVDRITTQGGRHRRDALKSRLLAMRHPIIDHAFFQFEIGNTGFEDCALQALEDLIGEHQRLTVELNTLNSGISVLEQKVQGLESTIVG